MTLEHSHQPMHHTPRFSYLGVPAPAESDWYESMSRTPTRDEWFPPRVLVSSNPLALVIPRKRESRGGVWVANEPQTPPPVNTSIFIPWCAGSSRHSIGAWTGDTNHRRPNMTAEGRKRDVALGLGPLPAGSGGRPATVTTAPTSSFVCL